RQGQKSPEKRRSAAVKCRCEVSRRSGGSGGRRSRCPRRGRKLGTQGQADRAGCGRRAAQAGVPRPPRPRPSALTAMTGDAPHPDDMDKSLTGLVIAVAGGLLMIAAFLQTGPLAAAAAVASGTALAGAAATLFRAHQAAQSLPLPPERARA